MYQILYRVYFILKRMQKNTNSSILVCLLQKIIGYIEAYYNLYVSKQYKNEKSSKIGTTIVKRNQQIIVSLTTFPKRIDTVWLTIESLLRQSVKPDQIILWLAKEQFPDEDLIPNSLLELQKRGLSIRFCDDIRSHKKYYYVMQENPDDLIVLVDDDTFYPYDLIKTLYKWHLKYPDQIISMTSVMISKDFSELPSKWTRIPNKERVIASYYAQPYSGQGTLYPPNVFPKNTFDKEAIMTLCPYADDLWLKFFSLTSKTKTTVVYPERDIPINIYGTGSSSLWYINGENGENDVQWQNLINHYPKEFELIQSLNCSNL